MVVRSDRLSRSRRRARRVKGDSAEFEGQNASDAECRLAVPAPELARLVVTGRSGRRLLDRVPELSELRRLRTASILVVTLVFKEKLTDMPPEHVGLAGSRGYMTFIRYFTALGKSERSASTPF